MKNFEKIVPAVAMSLVVAGFGAADAAAADTTTGTTDIQNDPVPTAETPAAEGASIEIMTVVEEPKAPETTEVTENTETKAPETTEVTENTETKETEPADTEITDVDQVTEGQETEGQETEGQETPEDSTVTETALLVNPTVEIDENGNPVVTNQGTLKKEESTTTVKNEDGSTNTRTTDNITGPITAPATGPSEEDVGNVKGDIEEIVNGQVGNGSFDKNAVADAIKNKYGVDSVTSSGENGKYTFTFQTSTTAENTPLNPSELAKVLGVDSLTPTDAENYTYTDKDGNTVTVKVIQDGTTTTIVTDWTVTVTEDTTQGTGETTETGDVTGNIDAVIDEASGLEKNEIKDILDWLDKAESVTNNEVNEDWDWSKTFTKDNYQYTVNYKENKTTFNANDKLVENTAELTSKYIYDHLLNDTQKGQFDLDENGNVTQNGYPVTFTVDKNGTITMTTYTYKVEKVEVPGTTNPPAGGGSGSTGDTGETEESKTSLKDLMDQVIDLAKKDAVLKALNQTMPEDEKYELKDLEFDFTNSKVTVKNTYKEYSFELETEGYTIKDANGNSIQIPDDDVPLANAGDVVKGEITATVTVNGEESGVVVPEEITLVFLKGLTQNYSGKTLFGENVLSASENNNTITVTTEILNGTKTYTFTYKEETKEIPGTPTAPSKVDSDALKQENNNLYWKADIKNEKNKSETGAWVFQRNNADLFVLKQSDYFLVWTTRDDFKDLTDEKTIQEMLIEIFKNDKGDLIDGSLKDKENGNGKEKHFVVVNVNELGEWFQMNQVAPAMGEPGDAWVHVTEDAIYVFGKNGNKDGLSHFLIGPGNTGGTTTTVETLEDTYKWESTAKFSGTGGASTKYEPGTPPEVTPDPDPEKVSGTLTGTKYKGDLDYSYTIPATNPETTWKVDVKAEAEEVRNVDVEVESSVTVKPEEPDEGDGDNTTPERPTDPGDRPSRPTNPDRDRPTNPPTTEITDPEVPLAETPEEPAVEIPDGDVPLAEIPEEEVPLADTPDVTIPDGDVPLAGAPGTPSVTIPDGEVPLADVPKTGDVSPLWSFSAILSALGLGVLLKKRKED